MLRISLIAIAFLSVTIVLILMQPSNVTLDEADLVAAPVLGSGVEVTRASTDLDRLTTEAGLTGVTGAEDDLRALTFEAMAGLETAPPALLEAKTENTLVASLSSVTAPGAADGGLELLVIKALQQGQSGAYIDALVNEAAESGDVDVPAALVTSDGRVDTRGLLAALSGSEPSNLTDTSGPQAYTIQPGDSLASISYRFYGTTTRHPDIFQANRSTISDAGQIEVGMQLIIPEF